MFKVAILGCENSHGYCFVDSVINHNLVDDVEFVGVYSDEEGAADKYAKDFGIYVAKSYDEFVGKVDGIIITALTATTTTSMPSPTSTAAFLCLSTSPSPAPKKTQRHLWQS